MDTMLSSMKDILRLISVRTTTEVVAPTGTGKSTLIPPFISYTGARVMVSVPTRTAARSLYQIVKFNFPKLRIGYAAQGEIRYDSKTQVIYATSGHVRRYLLRYFEEGNAFDISDIQALVVDEIHSGSVDNTIILSLWMEAYRKGKLIPRLVLITATPVPYTLEPKPERFEVSITSFPIEVEYLKNNYASVNELFQIIIDRAVLIHNTTPVTSGHIMIFLPSSSTVNNTMRELEKLNLKNAVVTGAYGSMEPKDVENIYKESPGKRKIIAVTNIAESSITIKDVGFVLDSMLENRPGTSSSGGLKLSRTLISKKSADQRKGRTGRTRPGKCVRFITLKRYQDLEENRPFDIYNVPIYNEIMELLNAGISPGTVLGYINKKVNNYLIILRSLGMADLVGVTDMGSFASQTTFSVRQSAFIWKWYHSQLPIYVSLVVAAIIDSEPSRLFIKPKRNVEETVADYNSRVRQHRELYYAKFVGDNDLATCLNVWKSLSDYIDSDDVKDFKYGKVKKWCRINAVNFKTINEIVLNIKQSIPVISRLMNTTVVKGGFTVTTVVEKALPLLWEINRDMIMTRQGKVYRFANSRSRGVPGTSMAVDKSEVYVLDRSGVPGDMNNYSQIISLGSFSFQTGKRVNRIITMAIPYGSTSEKNLSRQKESVKISLSSMSKKVTYLLALNHLERVAEFRSVGTEITLGEANASGQVDLLIHETYRKSLDLLRCSLRSWLRAENITNRVKLHLALRQDGGPTGDPGTISDLREVVPKSLIVNVSSTFEGKGPPGATDLIPSDLSISSDEPWIWRSESRTPDNQINKSLHILVSQKQILDLIQTFQSQTLASDKVIISKYVSTALRQGHKFRLRSFYMLTVDRRADIKDSFIKSPSGGNVHAYVWNEGLIGVSPSPYKAGDYSDLNIHTKQDFSSGLRFPRDFYVDIPSSGEASSSTLPKIQPQNPEVSVLKWLKEIPEGADLHRLIDDQVVQAHLEPIKDDLQRMKQELLVINVRSQIHYILKDITSKLASTIDIPNQRVNSGFCIFGADFILNDQGMVLCMEIDQLVDFRTHSASDKRWLSQTLFRPLVRNVIKPYFDGKPFLSSDLDIVKITESVSFDAASSSTPYTVS